MSTRAMASRYGGGDRAYIRPGSLAETFFPGAVRRKQEEEDRRRLEMEFQYLQKAQALEEASKRQAEERGFRYTGEGFAQVARTNPEATREAFQNNPEVIANALHGLLPKVPYRAEEGEIYQPGGSDYEMLGKFITAYTGEQGKTLGIPAATAKILSDVSEFTRQRKITDAASRLLSENPEILNNVGKFLNEFGTTKPFEARTGTETYTPERKITGPSEGQEIKMEGGFRDPKTGQVIGGEPVKRVKTIPGKSEKYISKKEEEEAARAEAEARAKEEQDRLEAEERTILERGKGGASNVPAPITSTKTAPTKPVGPAAGYGLESKLLEFLFKAGKRGNVFKMTPDTTAVSNPSRPILGDTNAPSTMLEEFLNRLKDRKRLLEEE